MALALRYKMYDVWLAGEGNSRMDIRSRRENTKKISGISVGCTKSSHRLSPYQGNFAIGEIIASKFINAK